MSAVNYDAETLVTGAFAQSGVEYIDLDQKLES